MQRAFGNNGFSFQLAILPATEKEKYSYKFDDDLRL